MCPMSKSTPEEVTFQVKNKDGTWTTVTAKGQSFGTKKENDEWEKKFWEDLENGLI